MTDSMTTTSATGAVAAPMLGPILMTPRLILRPPSAADLDGFAEMAADADSMRFLGGAVERPAAWRLLALMAGSWAINGFGMFSVIERATGAWVGRLGPWQPDSWPGTEVGWGLSPRFAGKGYALEATLVAMDWAFGHLGWTDVIHCIDPANAASIKLAEKLGSRDQGRVTLPPPNADLVVHAWGQTRDDWMRNRAALGAGPFPYS